MERKVVKQTIKNVRYQKNSVPFSMYVFVQKFLNSTATLCIFCILKKMIFCKQYFVLFVLFFLSFGLFQKVHCLYPTFSKSLLECPLFLKYQKSNNFENRTHPNHQQHYRKTDPCVTLKNLEITNAVTLLNCILFC